mmetsp:Transcript_22384/g.35972  ORF Transcript_22384/g.35972 Transcript_22384/m.35972 type:complete len:161 (-) Transcript_22384:223-705(-)
METPSATAPDNDELGGDEGKVLERKSKDEGIFDCVFNMEEEIHKKGKQRGIEDGRAKGLEEGRSLGEDQGKKTAMEMGFYLGFISILESLEKANDGKNKNRNKRFRGKTSQLAKLLKEYPFGESNAPNLSEIQDKIRAKFRKLQSQLQANAQSTESSLSF